MDERSVARGLALLLDRGTPTVEWRPLLDAEPALYSRRAIEMLGEMYAREWPFALGGDPRELSDTSGEVDSELAGRYGVIGRLLEQCRRDGVDRAVAAALDRLGRYPPA